MNQAQRRGRLLGGGLLLVWAGLLIKLVDVQILKWRYYEREAARLHYSRLELLGERGKIYDRKGRLLTLNRSCCSIRILPQWVRDKDTLAQIFADFGLGTFADNRKLLEEKKRLFWFRKYVDYQLGDSLRDVLVKRRFRNAVLINDDYRRLYPYGELCADVVGFVGAERGLAGLEWEFDSILRGEPGWIMLQRDALGYSYPYPSYPMKEPVAGADICLTIDADIQAICYRALESQVTKTQAKQGAAVVLDAKTGAILAMVDYPGYDPKRFGDYPKERYKAIAVSDQFEPGSSFKIVICAAALEDSHPQRFTERVYDVSSGYIQIGSKKIKDVHPNGVLSFDSVFIKSSNPACALMSFEVDPGLYYRIARGLGFAEPVGVGLPHEVAGRLDPPRFLRNRLRFATISFGQGVTVNLLQLAAAYLCIANDGVYLKPYLIQAVRQGKREILKVERVAARRVLKESTARRMKDILERVVIYGTGVLAAIPGVSVCGKTGTAQKIEPWGGYSSTRSQMTFVGFLPKDEPRYVIAVMIDEPRTVRFAGSAACPVFREIGENLLMREKIEPLAME